MKTHRLIRPGIVSLALLALILILPTALASLDGSARTGTGSLTYQLAWRAGDVTPVEDGTGWAVENDLGYHVTVERAYVVTYWVQLIECEPHDEHAFSEGGTALLDLLTPGIAYANHGDDSNQTRSNVSTVESLAGSQTDQTMAGLPVTQETYCQAHYLIGPASDSASGLPTDVDMLDRSLHLEGSYRAPGSDSETPFVIDSSMAFGVIVSLEAANGQVVTGEDAVQIVIFRDLTSIFDGLDFEGMSSDEMARSVLRQITASTQVIASH